MLHTGVSSDGTTLNRRALAGVLARSTISRPLVRTAKSGALSPAFSCGPTRVKGLPLNVTALVRFCMVRALSLGRSPLKQRGQDMNGRTESQTLARLNWH